MIAPLALVIVMVLWGCSRYTAPSPIDGTWRMVGIRNVSGMELPIPEGAVPYWDFSNVLYTVNYQPKGQVGVRRMGFGNVYFERDKMLLKANKGEAHFFPIPSTDKLAEVEFRYKVWDGQLTLIGSDYTIYLEKR